MAAAGSPLPNTDSDTEESNANPIPKSGSSNALVSTQSNSPAICFRRVAGDGAAGAFIGSIFGYVSGLTKTKDFKGSFVEAGSCAKTFAVMSGVHSLVACFLKRIRGKDDVINAGVAGCCTGLALSFPGAPQALLQSCITFGAFSFIIEEINKRQLAMALSFSARNKLDHHDGSRLLALPLAVSLPDELKGAFSFFCKSLRKPRNSEFPSSHR